VEESQASHGASDERRSHLRTEVLLKTVLWTDDSGRKKRSLIKDSDGPEMARYGIPANAPDIRNIDMETVFREIEALQYERGLFDWRAANNDQASIQACINVFKRELLKLYRNL
jgi:hypothetical protein